ncbi:MAG: HNH endonuclease [Leucobacter sp.]
MSAITTSRTGTAKYKRWRINILHQAQHEGITHCPCKAACTHHSGRPCLVRLDYNQGKRPNSAEPDHITPHAQGGRETHDNGQVLCRRCNQSQGDKRARVRAKPPTPITLTTSNW